MRTATPPATATPSRTATPSPLRRARRSFQIAPYLFAGAAALYLLLFMLVPLLTGVRLSFTDTRLLNPQGGDYVGLENYESLAGSGRFWSSVVTTLVYTALSVIGSVALGLASAVVINRAFPGRTLARAVMVMPWAVPTVALALIFRWIYNDSNGVANSITGALGLGSPGWLTDPTYGMAAVVIATVWKLSPFVMLIMLAALQSVPEELYESTRVDGADAYTTFKSIVLPFVMPTLRVVTLLMTIWSLRRFEVIWLLTGGGPSDATNTIVINVYREAFNNSQLGYAAAMGMLGLLLSLIVTVIYFLLERRSARQNGAPA